MYLPRKCILKILPRRCLNFTMKKSHLKIWIFAPKITFAILTFSQNKNFGAKIQILSFIKIYIFLDKNIGFVTVCKYLSRKNCIRRNWVVWCISRVIHEKQIPRDFRRGGGDKQWYIFFRNNHDAYHRLYSQCVQIPQKVSLKTELIWFLNFFWIFAPKIRFGKYFWPIFLKTLLTFLARKFK